MNGSFVLINKFALGIVRPVFVEKVEFVAAPAHAAYSGTCGTRRVAIRIVNVSVADINVQAMQIRMPVIYTTPTTGKSKNIET